MKKELYHFYGQTTSLCEECLSLVPAKIIFENNCVFYLKYCSIHKVQKTLISTDVNYYKKCRESTFLTYLPDKFNGLIDKSCPYDCGLCNDHEQHTAMGIIEILDECDLHCPTCIAASRPGAGNIRSISEVNQMLDTLVEFEGTPDLIMISGGEPTIHPNILEILSLSKTKNVKHLMLISNGVRIAEDLLFVEELKKIKENFEVYLQFDSMDPNVLMDIRGKDLSEIRIKAITNLDKAGIHSTLICVVKKGLNHNEMNEIIEFALKFKFIRGVTFQPCKITGRNEFFDKEKNYITLSEVRSNIINESNYFSEEDLIPHPLNPENICIGYLQKSDKYNKSVTSILFPNEVSKSNNEVQFSNSHELKSKMYFIPELDDENFQYENLFRVTIVSFLDKFNFCTSSVKKSCIHFLTIDKKIIPLDTYYLLYQNKNNSSPQLILPNLD